MSELIIAEKQDLTNIANAIREKTGSADEMYVSQMAEAIQGIEGGGGTVSTDTYTVRNNLSVGISWGGTYITAGGTVQFPFLQTGGQFIPLSVEETNGELSAYLNGTAAAPVLRAFKFYMSGSASEIGVTGAVGGFWIWALTTPTPIAIGDIVDIGSPT